MAECARAKLVLLQCSFTFRDGYAAGAGREPFVAFLEADATIALIDGGEFGESDGEIEGAAVAVPVVGLEIWSLFGGGLRHCSGWVVRRSCCR